MRLRLTITKGGPHGYTAIITDAADPEAEYMNVYLPQKEDCRAMAKYAVRLLNAEGVDESDLTVPA